MSKLFEILDFHKIPFLIISGRFEKESYAAEDNFFRPDIDLVLNCDKIQLIGLLLNNKDFKMVEDNVLVDIKLDLRIDLYFRSISVGYYHFLIPSLNSYKTQELAEVDYIIYQLIEPLLKFSKYHKRHIFRLEKYFFDGVPEKVSMRLSKIIGRSLSEELLNKVSNSEFYFSNTFIKKCKFRFYKFFFIIFKIT